MPDDSQRPVASADTTALATTWPEPYLQPDPHKECSFYAVAYMARCLGFTDVTAQQVMTWRQEKNRNEEWFIRVALGVPGYEHWHFAHDEGYRRRFWLGPDNRAFAEAWLKDHIALASVHRIATMAHSVVALETSDDGVLIMDPIYGHRVEPWDWFLGIGAGTHGCHRFAVLHHKWASREWEAQRLLLLGDSQKDSGE